MRFAISVVTTVLVTLLIAAAAHGATTARLRGTTAVQSLPSPSPSPFARPSLPALAPPPSKQPPATTSGTLFAWDADMVDAAHGWLLLSNCSGGASAPCQYFAATSVDGGQTWGHPVQVGPDFAPSDSDAPRLIRFLNRQDGFVYGHNSAFATHDGGATWNRLGVTAVYFNNIAVFGTYVWAVTVPCTKGILCQYEVRSSRDGGRTWSAPHKLPLNFSPDSAAAFTSGLILASLPPGRIELTTDLGTTWSDVQSPCREDQIRGSATTSDGSELWVLCEAYSSSPGSAGGRTLYVSPDAGVSWRASKLSGATQSWLVSPRPHVAFLPVQGATLVTYDSGVSWAQLPLGNVEFALVRFQSVDRGWALDTGRIAWTTFDGGANWTPLGSLPGTLS